jgi:hypothetical protein
MRPLIKTALILVSVVTLFSCAKNNNNSRNDIYANYIKNNNLVEVNKILAFQFQGWNALDYEHLIISSSHNKNFLVTLNFYCTDLRNAHSILLDQSMSSSLSSRFDSIIVPENKQVKCRIKSIHKITKEQKNDLTSLWKGSINN